MPAVEGSDEPAPAPDLFPASDASGKQTTWRKYIEPFNNHHHNESISTSASGSANSSPTTTVSTVDDSSATEMSPGSSPESPMSKPFPSSFPANHSRATTSDNESSLQPSTMSSDAHRPTTPGRRPRNLKNLAVNTSGAFHMSRAASTTSLPMASSLKESSEADIASRSFSKPPSPPKRRPTNLGLTILTPANTQALPHNVRVAIPPTPSFSRPNMLRHFQSSPSLPLHTSSKITEPTSAILTEHTSQAQQPGSLLPLQSDDSEPNFDIPLSKEEKPEAYPDGPICVYGPQLDLYLEPTADQALGYDVVINVASEVRNPFVSTKDVTPEPDIRLDGGGGIQYAPRRTLLDHQKGPKRDGLSPVLESSPNTPKATSSNSPFAFNQGPKSKDKAPEYIHIPWEHNTDIVPDTLQLVKMIDDRIDHGKRVLIHCQCGVSRSATLVVAYVIYKNPAMSVQEAYDTVKRRSKWIGPNMNLIMQLQEFRTALMRPMARFALSRGLSPISPSLTAKEWGLPGPHAEDIKSAPKTAPLPAQDGVKSNIVATRNMADLNEGPSSAPSGFAWPSLGDSTPPPASANGFIKSQDTAYVDPSGHVIPVVKVIEEPVANNLNPSNINNIGKDRPRSLNLDSHTRHDSGRGVSSMTSPRSSEFAMIPLQPPKEVESADEFGLMSPTTSEFSHSPWDRDALLGTLGMGSAMQLQPPSRNLQPSQKAQPPPQENSQTLSSGPKLRPKISAPSLQEQRKLQIMQSELEAKLAAQHATPHAHDASEAGAALMSPRAFEFTQNPFALGAEEPKTTASVLEVDDPRSPAQKGVSPITRNIFDVL